MKKLLQTYSENCIACRMCESTCSNLYFKVDDAERSRVRISDSPQPSINVCNQCETCVGACPTLALSVTSQGVVMLDKALCIGCYMCVAACPTGSMFRIQGQTNPIKCIACGACAKNCPADAIRIEERQEA